MLVVDDEPSLVDVICMALRHQGLKVAAAETGSEALNEARAWRPHAMVLDVTPPDMDGFEVARRLSAERAGVPILFLSARDNAADKVRGLTTGGDDYVTKPFSLEELIAGCATSCVAPVPTARSPADSASPIWRWTRRPGR
ncbi:MAG: response regulator [Solirubrobacteraceae bacterium]